MTGDSDGAAQPGDRFEVTVGAPAHGSHFVARAPDGRVVFVRHALPGEQVVAEVTEVHAGYLRADAVLIRTPSPDRVAPPCPYAGVCGGCDFQHVAPAAQRDLKVTILREQLTRLGRLTPAELDALDLRVVELPGGALGWRTRVQYTVNAAGRAGLLAHRSHQVVPVDRCRIAHPTIQRLDLTSRDWPHDDRVEAIASADGEVTVLGDRSGVLAGPGTVTERAAGRTWELPPAAFWQVHPGAPEAFVGTVLELLDPRPGEVCWDLYGGAGLFAAALAVRVGRDGTVLLVEADPVAVAAARQALGDLGQVRVVPGAVARARLTVPTDLVVLDPPRSGAGATVVRVVAASGARAVAYVACDPAAFARDVATFRSLGWRLSVLRGFDAFPMTQHLECVGLLEPTTPR